jgi:hypothetical protein
MGQKGSRGLRRRQIGEIFARSATKRAVIPDVFHDLGSEEAPRDTFDPKSCPGAPPDVRGHRNTSDLSWYCLLIPARRRAGCRRWHERPMKHGGDARRPAEATDHPDGTAVTYRTGHPPLNPGRVLTTDAAPHGDRGGAGWYRRQTARRRRRRGPGCATGQSRRRPFRYGRLFCIQCRSRYGPQGSVGANGHFLGHRISSSPPASCHHPLGVMCRDRGERKS